MSLDKQYEHLTDQGSVCVNTDGIKVMNIHTEMTETCTDNYFGVETRPLHAGNAETPEPVNEQTSLDKQYEHLTGQGSVCVNTDGIKAMTIHTEVTKTSIVNYFEVGTTPQNPAIVNEQTSPEITTLDISGLKTSLRDFYKELTLPCITWLEEREDLYIDDYFIDLILDISDTMIKKEEIFNPVNEQQPSRILIEGQPGSGKTSLATRIACDWAKEKEYVSQFELVFLLPLRELQQQSVDDAIKSIGQISGFKDYNNIDGMIASNEQQILFIFDGLDELSVADRSSLLELLYEQKYKEATILVTCRTGLFTLTKDERKQLFKRINKSSKFCNKQMSILGITNNEKKMEFLEKFIMTDDSNKSNLLANIKSTVTKNKLFDCPLFLILLAFIVNTEENVDTFLSRTELYKILFNSIIKNSSERNETPLDDCFDLFDSQSLDEGTHKLIGEFGKLSWQHILENNFQFKCDGLTERIYKLGFLSNHKKVIRFQSNQYYEAFHLSIMEFSAAYYMWLQYKSNESEFKENLLKPVLKHYLSTRGTSLVLSFMVGLFQDQSCDIFDAIQSHSCCFSSNFQYVEQLMKECSSSRAYNKILPSIINFLPVHLDLRMNFLKDSFGLKWFEKLIEYGIECGRVESVYGHNLIRTQRLKNLHPPIAKLTLDRIEDLNDVLTDLACELHELQIGILSLNYRKPSTEDLARIASTFTSLQSVTCSLKLHCEDVSLSCTNPKLCLDSDDLFFQNSFYFFSVNIATREKELFTISLLKKTQLRILKVRLASGDLDLCDLVDAIANSSSLLYFTFNTAFNAVFDTAIDLSDLTKGGMKTYEYLELKNCIVNCRQPLTNRNCIKMLSIDDVSREVLLEIEPANLICNISGVRELVEMNPAWCGINSLKYINIYESILDTDEQCVDSTVETKRLLGFLSTCRSLQTLEISSNVFEDAQTLVEGLKQLPIEKLVYSGRDWDKLYLFKTMNGNWKSDDEVKLLSIDYIFLGSVPTLKEPFANYILAEIFELVNGLQRRNWQRVNFVCCDMSFVLFALNDANIIDLTLFNVVHYKYGSESDNPDFYKFYFSQRAFSLPLADIDAFAITLK